MAKSLMGVFNQISAVKLMPSPYYQPGQYFSSTAGTIFITTSTTSYSGISFTSTGPTVADAPRSHRALALHASDLMEEFVKYAGERGVPEQIVRRAPLDLLILYTVGAGAVDEGKEFPTDIKTRLDALLAELKA